MTLPGKRFGRRESSCCTCADPSVGNFSGFEWCAFHLERVQAIVAAANAPAPEARRHRKRSPYRGAPATQRRARLLELLRQHPGLTSRDVVRHLRSSLGTVTHDLRTLKALGKVRSAPQPREAGHRGRYRWLWTLNQHAKAS